MRHGMQQAGASEIGRRRRFGAAGLLLAAGFIASCTGAGAETGRDPALRCNGETFRISHVDGGNAPYIRLSADQYTGAFLLDYGATFSTLSRTRVGSARDVQAIDITRFTLPSFRSGRFLLADYTVKAAPRGGQVGVVGTDFLSLLTADFSFRTNQSDVVLSPAPCDEARLRQRGLMPIDQTGFFSSRPTRRTNARANVPVIFLRLGSVVTSAQIDSGYDDIAAPLSIDINEALYARLRSAGVALQRRADITVTTCVGRETRRAYEIANVTIQSDTGQPIRRLHDVTLLRKSSKACGGIAQQAQPAAQIAASVMRHLGEVVFDPKSERLWLKPDQDLRK